MDANKAQKLRDINYTMPGVCGQCKHGIFKESRHSDPRWGECSLFFYEHLKHSDSKRHLSISIFGKCTSFSMTDDEKVELHNFIEFAKQ